MAGRGWPRMRILPMALALAIMAAPGVAAHGALELNKFDTYALSDFEGHEDSFPWEGFEIWDVYVGDGYNTALASHGVYFKGNFAGDGTVRPTGGASWGLEFTFDVGGQSYTRWIAHDGAEVTTDFEQLEHQIADGNVLQIHAWVPIPEWDGHEVANLVVVSSVDGSPRDVAPGGFFDPVLGQEIPFSAPPTVIFPAMGEGRVVDTVPLTGAAKFLEVAVAGSDGTYTFTVNNTLASQGQHFMLQVPSMGNWTINGRPNPESLEGGASSSFTLDLTPGNGVVAPLRLDFTTDIGGRQSWFAYANAEGVQLTQDEAMAVMFEAEVPVGEESPGIAVVAVLGLVGSLGWMRRRFE